MSGEHPESGKRRAWGLAALRDWWAGARPGEVLDGDAAPAEPVVSVLFVCLGNLCRSPTAEVVLRDKLKRAGLQGQVSVDSAGTHASWPKGQGADPRAVAHARRRGYDLSAFRARALLADDFERHDFVLAMDDDNLTVLTRRCPEALRPRLGRLAPHGQLGVAVIPDPYYGSAEGFERVLDLVEDACDGLVVRLAQQVHGR